MNKEFRRDVSPCEVSESELALINKYAIRKLSDDEVFTFNVILCDNEIDRDIERFDKTALEKLAELFVGVTGIFDHNPKSTNQSARIYSAECITDAQKTNSIGEPYVCVKAKAYMPRTEKNESLIAEIESGIKREVSVSCAVNGFTCSICGGDMRYNNCNHIKGNFYGEKMCYCTLSDITDAYEWSFVAVPAQMNAGVTKSYIKEPENMDDCIKSIKKGNAVNLSDIQSKQLSEYIAKLEKLADDGKVFRRQLIGEAKKFAMISVPTLNADSVEKMCAGVDTDELIKIRDAFKKKAGEIVPLAPQLKAKEQNAVMNNSDYKF